jgi:uncharacterized protein (DUF305 family)
LSKSRPLAAAALSVVLATGLVACGGEDEGLQPDSATSTAPNGDVYNSADVEFATQMIPHHAQAVQMAEMTRGRPLDPPVRRLVDRIREAQVPEVQQMSGWLTAWGEEVPATSLDHAHAHDMGNMDGMEGADEMPGMMSADEMAALEQASDAEFQDRWLQMMVEHHQGAIEMAADEQEQGRFREAVRLAKGISASQAAEIDAMEKLLG